MSQDEYRKGRHLLEAAGLLLEDTQEKYLARFKENCHKYTRLLEILDEKGLLNKDNLDLALKHKYPIELLTDAMEVSLQEGLLADDRDEDWAKANFEAVARHAENPANIAIALRELHKQDLLTVQTREAVARHSDPSAAGMAIIELSRHHLAQVYMDVVLKSDIPEEVAESLILLHNKGLLGANHEKIVHHPSISSVARATRTLEPFGLLNQANLEQVVIPYAETLFDYWLEGLWMKIPRSDEAQEPWLTQARLDALCQAPHAEIRDRAFNTLLNIPEVFAGMTCCSGKYEAYYRPYYKPFMDEKLHSLAERKASFIPSTAEETFDISQEEAELYYHFISYFIHHSGSPSSEFRFLLDIPRIRSMAPSSGRDSKPNALLRSALYVDNKCAVDILMEIPEVRELAEELGQLPLSTVGNTSGVRFFGQSNTPSNAEVGREQPLEPQVSSPKWQR